MAPKQVINKLIGNHKVLGCSQGRPQIKCQCYNTALTDDLFVVAGHNLVDQGQELHDRRARRVNSIQSAHPVCEEWRVEKVKGNILTNHADQQGKLLLELDVLTGSDNKTMASKTCFAGLTRQLHPCNKASKFSLNIPALVVGLDEQCTVDERLNHVLVVMACMGQEVRSSMVRLLHDGRMSPSALLSG